MRKGTLRWDEMMLAEYAARQSRWAPATDQRREPDAEVAGPLGAQAAGGLTHPVPGKGRGPSPHSQRAKADAAPVPSSGPADAASSAPYPLVTLCRDAGLPEPIHEYRFHPYRKWRADYAWPLQRVIVEVEGGIWTQGRHTRGAGFLADMAKYNAAALLGFHILRYTPQQLGDAVADLRMMLA